MSQQNFEVCPLFEFRPLDGHSFTSVYEIVLEYSDSCIELAAYLSRETAPHPYFSSYSPGHIQDGVQNVFQSYAHLFVRTIAIIPVEFVPPGSHISNINGKIEGRPVAVDLKKSEIVFRIDDTSIRKLEVFYTELTGKEPNSWFTEKLDQLRVRMAMSKAMGCDLLAFKEVLGDLFDTGGLNNHVRSERVRGCRSPFPNLRDVGRDKWTSFRTPPTQPEGRFPPTRYEPHYGDGIFPTVIASKSLHDALNLETFPQDRSTSPQTYWGRSHVTQPPSQQATATNGKPYGALGHNRRGYRFPPQPSTGFPAFSSRDRNFQQQPSNSPPAWVTDFLNGAQAGHRGLMQRRPSQHSSHTPSLSRRSSSSDMRSEVSTPSFASTTFQPLVRSTSESSPAGSDYALTDVSWEEREYTHDRGTTNSWNKRRVARSDEYNFISIADTGRMPSANRAERDLDPTKAIIQGKMEAMLGAAESGGYICKATLDGVDNHPISVRLKTISGSHESLKTILGSRECSTTTNYETSLNVNRESNPPSINTAETFGRPQYSNTSNAQSLRGNHTTNSAPSIPTTSSIAGASQPRDYGQLHDENFSEYNVGLDLNRSPEDLKALKLNLELEGEEIMEFYRRNLKKIQSVEAAILRSESDDLEVRNRGREMVEVRSRGREMVEVRNRAREMVEFCGYDESAFIHESDGGNPNHTSEEATVVAKEVEGSFVKQDAGRSNAIESDFQGIPPSTVPLNVSTRHYENHIEHNNAASPCRQFATTPTCCHLEDRSIFYAHSNVPIAMPTPIRQTSLSKLEAAALAESWELNYTVGAQREREVQQYQQSFFDVNPNTSAGGMPGFMQSSPPHWSYFGTERFNPSEHFFPVLSQQYAATHHLSNYDSLALQRQTHQNEPAPNNYFERLAEYYRTTHGEAIDAGGIYVPTTYTTYNFVTNENIGTGF